MANYNESINGDIIVYSDDTDAGLSGMSPDFDGGQPASFIIYWTWPAGFTNRQWPTDFTGFSDVQSIVNDDTTYPEARDKETAINRVVYAYGRNKLEYGWDDYYEMYGSRGYGCVRLT